MSEVLPVVYLARHGETAWASPVSIGFVPIWPWPRRPSQNGGCARISWS